VTSTPKREPLPQRGNPYPKEGTPTPKREPLSQRGNPYPKEGTPTPKRAPLWQIILRELLIYLVQNNE